MKNLNPRTFTHVYTFLLFFGYAYFLGIPANAQCPSGNVDLFLQIAVDDFVANYPNCTTINGSLSIRGGVTDLSQLSNLTAITGDLTINVSSLSFSSLNGLSNISTIGGSLFIENNGFITNLNDLSNLTDIGGQISIIRNSSLLNIDGLSNISSVSTVLNISHNSSLEDINGLSNITSVDGFVYITNNPEITDVDGLYRLTSVTEEFQIASNANLTNLDGLSNFTSAGNPNLFLSITDNPLLTNFDGICPLFAAGLDLNKFNQRDNGAIFDPQSCPPCPIGDVSITSQQELEDFVSNYPNCTDLSGNLLINSSDISDLSPLSAIQTISGNLTIRENSQLTEINAFPNLTSIGGNLEIELTSTLMKIDGFPLLETIEGQLLIVENNSLSEINGFPSLSSVGELIIFINPQLTNLSVFCPLLNEGTVGDIRIFENGAEFDPNTDCSSCVIESISAGAQNCEDGGTTYSQEITVTFQGGEGLLVVTANGRENIFPIVSSPQTVILNGLPLDGNPVSIIAGFTGNDECIITEEDFYIAPSALTMKSIDDIDICVGTEVNLLITLGLGGVAPFTYLWTPGGQTTQEVSLTPTDTTEYTVTVTDAIGCEVSDTFIIEPSASSVFNVIPLGQSACDPWTNTYSQIVEVTYAGGSATSMLNVNSQLFPLEGSPQTVELVDLPSDGQPVGVEAFLTGLGGCDFEQPAVFTAPEDCSVPCDIINVTAGDPYDCDPNTDTYKRDLIVEYQGTNLPGGIEVFLSDDTSFSFPQTFESPQVVTLTNLPSDGQWVTISVSIFESEGCEFFAENFFQNPQDCGNNPGSNCDITDISAGDQRCNPDNNTYEQDLILTYTDAPTTGSIQVKVDNQSGWKLFPIESSPQTLTLTDLNPNGDDIDIFVRFTDKRNCTFRVNNLFTAPTDCTPPPSGDGNILFVVRSANNIHSGDIAVKDRLESLGYTVMVKGQGPAKTEDANGKVLVLISNTVSSNAVNTKFTYVNVPVVTYESLLLDDLGMTGNNNGISYGQDGNELTMDIDNPGHPMAAGLSGEPQVYNNKGDIIWGKPNNNAIKVASTQGGYQNQWAIFGYETGSEMVNGTAPARRVSLFFKANQVNKLNNNGWALFDAVICWASGCESARFTPQSSFVPSVKAYPNPFRNELTIEWEGHAQEVNVSLTNLMGQRVFSQHLRLENRHQFSIGDLPEGMYILQVTGENFKQEMKVVKE